MIRLLCLHLQSLPSFQYAFFCDAGARVSDLMLDQILADVLHCEESGHFPVDKVYRLVGEGTDRAVVGQGCGLKLFHWLLPSFHAFDASDAFDK